MEQTPWVLCSSKEEAARRRVGRNWGKTHGHQVDLSNGAFSSLRNQQVNLGAVSGPLLGHKVQTAGVCTC